jgi:hypothetical protein
VLHELSLLGLEPVEARRDQGMQRVGNVDPVERPDDLQGVVHAGERVEQHADRLDRVEADAVHALADLRAHVVGKGPGRARR